jgi:hypothetical protein
MMADVVASGVSANSPSRVRPTTSRRGGRVREFAVSPLPQARLTIPPGLTQVGEQALRAAIDRVATSKAANTLRGYVGDWSVWLGSARPRPGHSMTGVDARVVWSAIAIRREAGSGT